MLTASSNPTVGAQYRWTALYAPPRFLSPAFWSLLQGSYAPKSRFCIVEIANFVAQDG